MADPLKGVDHKFNLIKCIFFEFLMCIATLKGGRYSYMQNRTNHVKCIGKL